MPYFAVSVCLVMCVKTAGLVANSILGKIFSRRHFEKKFLFFQKQKKQQQDLTFHANCLDRNANTSFQWGGKKKSYLSSAAVVIGTLRVKNYYSGSFLAPNKVRI